MESHPEEEEAIEERADAAPMEHLPASEERVAQPSQKVVNQAVQSQSPQPQAGRSSGYVAAANMDNRRCLCSIRHRPLLRQRKP
ncbi:MAG: hypothetical protein V8S36_06300 [Lachnospiraceae bacterium]